MTSINHPHRKPHVRNVTYNIRHNIRSHAIECEIIKKKIKKNFIEGNTKSCIIWRNKIIQNKKEQYYYYIYGEYLYFASLYISVHWIGKV